MRKTIQTKPLNKQSSVLVDCQTDIKTTIKNGVLSGAPSFVIRAKITRIIENALRLIASSALRENARISLMQFAERTYTTLRAALPSETIAVAVYTLIKGISHRSSIGEDTAFFVPKTTAEKNAAKALFFHTDAKGIPLQEFQKNYINRVQKALGDICNQHALDADDITGRNTLRNFAEMQTRYEQHLEDIQKLKDDGQKLVVCSVHSDCSDRCKEWQGHVYSLDGTYGKTEDGREYVPLEVATDIYYTTKKGKTYKNGLLGFNCRHKLYPYKEGMVIPCVSEAERKEEYAITKRQRELERTVIHWRETALMQKGVDVNAYKEAKRNATNAYEQYKTFSKENGRAYYPDRVKIL